MLEPGKRGLVVKAFATKGIRIRVRIPCNHVKVPVDVARWSCAVSLVQVLGKRVETGGPGGSVAGKSTTNSTPA